MAPTKHLILIPGMMCDERLYNPQVEALKQHYRGAINIRIAPINDYDNVAQLASNILAQAPQQFSLGGLSMGGIVAMEMVNQAAHRIERLCLMDTNPLAEEEERKSHRGRQIQKAQTGKLHEVIRDEMKPNYLSPNLSTNTRQAILDLCMDMALALGEAVFTRQSNALKNRPDQCDTLKKVHCPTLVLHGESDILCPAHRHELIKQLIPHAHYHIIDNAGHLPTLENPSALTQQLINWLNA